jgi:hypothetical protein
MKNKNPNSLNIKTADSNLTIQYDEDDLFSIQLGNILDDLGEEEVKRISNLPKEKLVIIQESDLMKPE